MLTPDLLKINVTISAKMYYKPSPCSEMLPYSYMWEFF